MWSLFRTALALSLCALLANCSLFWKSEVEKEEELARFQDYYPSDVYKDINGGEESEDRNTASYSDDDYAAADEDPVAATQNDEQNAYLDKEIDKEDQGVATMDMGEDPLDYQQVEPSQAAEEPQAIKPVAKAWPTKFKNSMHKFSKKCNMRMSADKGAKSAGKVSTKRKLWVENHNADWVVVQRKAGPAYIHKSCL